MKTIDEVKAVVRAAFDHDIDLFWSVDENDEVRAAIVVNDVFFWGCSDCEDVEVEDLPMLNQAMKDGGYILWKYLFVCRKRKMRPQGAWINGTLFNDNVLRQHFLDAGPVREIDVGNPKELE